MDEALNWSEISNIASWATLDTMDTTPPAAVMDLAAVNTTDYSVTLQWTAPGDDGTAGAAFLYDIRFSTAPINDATWDAASQALGEPSPQTAGNTETFVVTGLTQDTDYHFVLKTADDEYNWSALSNKDGQRPSRSPVHAIRVCTTKTVLISRNSDSSSAAA